MPHSEQKLTKKQKKSLAFRQRTNVKKSTLINDGPVLEDKALCPADSAMENEMVAIDEGDTVEVDVVEAPTGQKHKPNQRNSKEATKKSMGMEKALDNVGDKKTTRSSKRKLEELRGDNSESFNKGEEVDEDVRQKRRKTEGDTHKRFILFVGNLKYTTTTDAIQEHFSSCDPPPVIRLLTPKPNANAKSSTKSKGCAFLEFTHRGALQQALKLHQSKLDGRLINVELTAGGGGKGEVRLKKLQNRNKDLHGQRKKKYQKPSKTAEEHPATGTNDLDQPQRYSLTSGIGQAPQKKRTWAVGEEEESKSKSKTRRKLSRNLGTGVNAIPVG
ncbi:hypothetical protein AMATHDRAFT_378 [Amanita thiersii Skay4041]|uniref:RRM domain-containing protein n=1 Tax=Amanita thiersii Skay4041 TaxID=703135 RepID=A0A2A9P1Z2_9AGAR|nr:hypothetical protein AMATHDRAFT_378 [Amanita thiersii Skay4041]